MLTDRFFPFLSFAPRLRQFTGCTGLNGGRGDSRVSLSQRAVPFAFARCLLGYRAAQEAITFLRGTKHLLPAVGRQRGFIISRLPLIRAA